MWKWLASIRTKPKAIRDQYAFGIAATFTGLVIALWSFSLPARFSELPDDTVAKAPFAGLVQQVSSGVGAMRTQVAAVMKSSVVPELPPEVATTTPPPAGLPNAYELWTDIGDSTTTPTIVEIRVATSATPVIATSSTGTTTR